MRLFLDVYTFSIKTSLSIGASIRIGIMRECLSVSVSLFVRVSVSVLVWLVCVLVYVYVFVPQTHSNTYAYLSCLHILK